MTLQQIITNLKNAAVRQETLHGKQYTVAPMVMMTVGVHNGNQGPLLYTEDDLKNSIPAWNMKPIVVYHPELNGKGVSACDPDILATQQIGMVMHAKYDGKQRAEAWIDNELANNVDDRVLEAIEEGQMMEVSTGLFTDKKEEAGEWEGEEYTGVATNHRPDHLAVLPDKIGACSIADGAGLLQLNEAAEQVPNENLGPAYTRKMKELRAIVGNAMSHSNTYSRLASALRERHASDEGGGVYIADVYDDFFVFEIYGDGTTKLFKLGYSMTEHNVTLSDDEAVEVMRVSEYRDLNGTFVGNEAQNTKGANAMEKKDLVDGLINNEATSWVEGDRETLMGFEDDQLKKMTPVANADMKAGKKADAKKADKKADDKEEEKGKGKGKEVTDNAADVTANTAEEYLASAPVEIKDFLTNAVATHNQQKEEVIAKLVENSDFTAEFLRGKNLDELKGMESLMGAKAPAPVANTQARPPMFQGQATPATSPVTNAGNTPTGLALPSMDFTSK